MAWKETCPVKQRRQFVIEWELEWEDSGCRRVNMSALCRAYGISRQTGYKWLWRYLSARRKLEALDDRSRRPKSSPTAIPKHFVAVIVRARKAHPRWGARKLRTWLRRRARVLQNTGYRVDDVPAASTIGRILHERRLVRPRRRRKRSPPYSQPFASCSGPNVVWCVDFKGHFRTLDGTKCFPLTIMDAYSRKLLCCEIVLEPDEESVRPIFERVFKKFGLPGAIRSDNGPPFATVSAGGLSRLSVWWTHLGIRHERIAPGKPQQNGRHERMHSTLKQEAVSPPRATVEEQQRALDRFVVSYNSQRPHDALAGKTPNDVYSKSPRRFRAKLPPFMYPDDCEVCRVWSNGSIRLGKRRLHLGLPLAGERVGMRWIRDQKWEVLLGPVTVGIFDLLRRSLVSSQPRQNGRTPFAEVPLGSSPSGGDSKTTLIAARWRRRRAGVPVTKR